VTVYIQDLNPTDHLAFSALLAVLPLATLLVLLAGLKWKAHWAGLAALGVSLLVALFAYSMPLGQALNAGWSLLGLLVLCVLSWLQSTSVLGWMVP
jgi:lactate permease